MPTLLVPALVALALYGALIVALLLAGRREAARAVAGFVPDCVVLFRRLLGDPRVDRACKLVLAGAVAYLAMPFDLVPDFIPVAGQLDDALVVALALRVTLRGGGAALTAEHWPGPTATRRVIERLAAR